MICRLAQQCEDGVHIINQVLDRLQEYDDIVNVNKAGSPLVFRQSNVQCSLECRRSILLSERHVFELVQSGVSCECCFRLVFFREWHLPESAQGV